MRRTHLIVFSVLFIASIPGLAASVTPGPAVFGNLMTIDDYLTRVYDTGQLIYPQPSLLQQAYSTGGGGNVGVSSQSSVAATGAPFVKAQVDADYLGSYGVTGRSSASLSYQVVITGGTPGTMTPVNFGTFGELTNSSTCSNCPVSGWWSASALLQIVDPATATSYFQLDGTTDTLYQSGSGTTPIAIFTTLDLPIDVPLDVILGVTAYAYTQEKWLNQLIGPVTSLAYLDPVFEPLEAGISVLQSSNLVAPTNVPLPASVDLLIAGLLVLVVARSRGRALQSRPIHR
jgi:hypothetical protein